jgi:hypothetical protein
MVVDINDILDYHRPIPVSWVAMFTVSVNLVPDVIRTNVNTAIKKNNLKKLMLYVLGVNDAEMNKKFRNELFLTDEKLAEKFDKLCILI